jgi:hypothetical protein
MSLSAWTFCAPNGMKSLQSVGLFRGKPSYFVADALRGRIPLPGSRFHADNADRF